MATYYTFFSEYRRGAIPADWTERWTTGTSIVVEGAFCDLPNRNVLRLTGAGTRTAFTWNVIDSDLVANAQELYCRFRWVTTASNRAVALIRVSGTLSAENAYRLVINLVGTPEMTVDKMVAGVTTSLGTASKPEAKLGMWLNLRFRANSATIQAKLWADGDTEPVAWDVSVTDGSVSTGSIGVSWVSTAEIGEVAYFAVGTGGDSAPSESEALALTPPMDTWVANLEDEIEITARFDYWSDDANAVQSVWYSTHPRITSSIDYPANTVMEKLLIDAGGLATRLESDVALSGAALTNLSPIRLDNRPVSPGSPGPLDAWIDYSFYGRPIEIRIGRRWQTKPHLTSHGNGVLTPHRRFEMLGCGIAATEPTISSEEAQVTLTSPTGLLSQKVIAYRNVGIPTGVKAVTTSGWLRIPSSTSYDLMHWNLYLRILVPTAGVTGSSVSTIARRQIDATHRQWHVALYQASHATLAHTLHFISDSVSGANLISLNPSTRYNLGRFIDIIFSVKGTDRWYAYVDGVKVGSGSLAANVTLGTAAIVEANIAPGVILCDHRIEQWAPEDEALARFSARRDTDALTVSMHRCDDNTGSTVTDYAALANHGTLQGSDTTDRVWSPTYLGSAEQTGTPMPISGGVVFHGPGQPIDSVREAFRYNDRVKTTGTALAVRARGALLTVTTNYTEPSDGPGVIDVVGASDQPVTFQLSSSSSPEDERTHIPRLVADTLSARGNVSVASYNRESFLALRKQLPFKGGYYYPESPDIQTFLADMIGQIGGYYGLDYGRLYAACMTPPINPGPFGNEPFLEFLGVPDRGLILAASTAYDLNNTTNDWSIDCFFKFHAKPIDLITSSTFTHFPTGYTLIDRYSSASSGSGYYLGFDGRNGNLVFATPGLTSSGRHYISLTYNFQPDTWYWAHGEISATTRFLGVGIDLGFGGETSETVTGTWVAPVAGTPLRIGHGPAGSFPGSIAYAIGASPRASVFAPSVKPTTSNRGGTQRFHLPLTDGAGDQALERIQSKYARLDSCRWAYKLIMDFRSAAQPTYSGTRRPWPAWRVDTRYRRNYQPISGANVAAGVSASDRVALGVESLSETDQSEMVRLHNLNSRDMQITTPLSTQADADAVGRLIRGRLSEGRRLGVASDWYRDMLRLMLTDEVLVYHDRYGLSAGKCMRVAAIASKLAALRGTVDLWG